MQDNPSILVENGGSMTYEFLDISVSDGVAIVTINRPEVLNGLHPDSHREMEQVWGDLGAVSYTHLTLPTIVSV